MQRASAAAGELSFDDVSHFLLSGPEHLAPYPPCLDRHIKSVHAYLVAVPITVDAPEDAVRSAHEEAGGVPCVVGVIAVSWVDLSAMARMPANAVQGYLQIVAVHRSYRQQGIATALLTHLLAERDRSAITSGPLPHCSAVGEAAPGGTSGSQAGAKLPSSLGVREARKEANGATAVAHPITSWMLHTMSSTSVSTRAYLRHRLSSARSEPSSTASATTAATRTDVVEPHEGVASGTGDHSFSSPASTPPAPVSTGPPLGLAAEVDKELEGVRAVMAMYAKHGFVERRTLYRYYGRLADAVEMVRTAERVLKTSRE